MVFVKKGQTPNKNTKMMKGKNAQKKKAEKSFDEIDDSDDSLDSDEAPQLTPANKGAKGRFSMSEKKVSFAVPGGKGSPAVKTPKKENQAQAKKQPTPASKGRTSLQEFKGLKRAQPEDDDDDDEEDEDFEIDEEDEDDDLDIDLGDEDDDDDNSKDDDEDDSKDDDDKVEEGDEDGGSDEEEDEDDSDTNDKDAGKKEKHVKEATISKKILKEKIGLQKKIKKTKQEANAKILNLIKSSKVEESKPVNEVVSAEIERRRQDDEKKVYIGKLPDGVTKEDLEGLSKDIVDVVIPYIHQRRAGDTQTVRYAFLVFDSEAKAEANFKVLQTKKLKGQPLTVDLVGHKNLHGKFEKPNQFEFNLRKLYIPSLPAGVTIDQVAVFFKEAQAISFGFVPANRCATISFFTEESAKEAYDASRELEISGQKQTVMYSRKSFDSIATGEKRKKKKKSKKRAMKFENQNGGEGPSKKMKMETQ